MRVTELRIEHIPRLVEVHQRAFPDFFLTSLGTGILREYYGSFCRFPQAIGFVLEDGAGDVIGFVVGTLDSSGHFRWLVRHRALWLSIQLFPALVLRPAVILRLLRRASEDSRGPSALKGALLASLAVDVERQRQGGGTRLLDAFVHEALARGASGVFLTTDSLENDGVNSFYKRNGWKLECSYTSGGRQLNRYVFDSPPGGLHAQ